MLHHEEGTCLCSNIDTACVPSDCCRFTVIPCALVSPKSSTCLSSNSCICCSRLPVTAVCLSSDESTVYSVSKDGVICAHDIQTGKRSKFDWQHTDPSSQSTGTTADWVKRKAQSVGKNALLAIAISFDDRYMCKLSLV